MDSVLDFLFLRRLKFEYTSPPICPITPASASGLSITGQVISPILSLPAPEVANGFILLPCSASTIAFNIYQAEQIGNPTGAFSPLVEGLLPPTVSVCRAGSYVAQALSATGQVLASSTFSCDGVNRLNFNLPVPSGTASYNLYEDGVLALSDFTCGAVQICVQNCFSITAITSDGETPLSPPTCTIPPPPLINIVAPTAGESFSGGSLITVAAAVTLTDGYTLNYVQFFDGPTLIATVVSPPYSFVWNGALSGSHTLTAVLHFDGNRQVASPPVNITVSGCAFVDSWVVRVMNNGGATPSSNTQNALCDFYNGLVADGLDSLMISWNAIVPDNIIAARTPQLLGVGLDPWGDAGIPLAPGNLSVNGLTVTAGASTGMNSGLNPTTIYSNDGDAGLTFYMAAGATVSNAECFGAGRPGPGGSSFGIIPNYPAAGFFFECWGNSGLCPDRINNVGLGNFNGYYSCNRTSTSAMAAYKANSSTPHGPIGTCAGLETFVRANGSIWAIVDQAFGAGAHPGTFSFFAVHHGMTQIQSSLFYARIQTLRQALGGGFV